MPNRRWPTAKETDIGGLVTLVRFTYCRQREKRRGATLALILSLLLGGGLAGGCGVKGLPTPLWPSAPLPVVSGLAYQMTDGQVTLTWRLPALLADKTAAQAYFIIRRSQSSLDPAVCENCPRVYRTVARIPYVETTNAAYSHPLVLQAGYRYAFTVHLQSGKDVGADCDPVQFDIPSDGTVSPVEEP